jgi:hypothetical protein
MTEASQWAVRIVMRNLGIVTAEEEKEQQGRWAMEGKGRSQRLQWLDSMHLLEEHERVWEW